MQPMEPPYNLFQYPDREKACTTLASTLTKTMITDTPSEKGGTAAPPSQPSTLLPHSPSRLLSKWGDLITWTNWYSCSHCQFILDIVFLQIVPSAISGNIDEETQAASHRRGRHWFDRILPLWRAMHCFYPSASHIWLFSYSYIYISKSWVESRALYSALECGSVVAEGTQFAVPYVKYGPDPGHWGSLWSTLEQSGSAPKHASTWFIALYTVSLQSSEFYLFSFIVLQSSHTLVQTMTRITLYRQSFPQLLLKNYLLYIINCDHVTLSPLPPPQKIQESHQISIKQLTGKL